MNCTLFPLLIDKVGGMPRDECQSMVGKIKGTEEERTKIYLKRKKIVQSIDEIFENKVNLFNRNELRLDDLFIHD